MRLPASLIFDMEQAETKDLLIDIFNPAVLRAGLWHVPPCRLGGAGVSSCHRPRRRYAAVMGPYTRHADHDPIGEGGLLGLGHDSLSSTRVARPLFEQKADTDVEL